MARNPDEVSLSIGERDWRWWSSIELTRAIDEYSTVRVTAPFEPGRAEFRETFRPFTFRPMRVAIGGATHVTGTMVDVFPRLGDAECTVEASGYALPGVLGDCHEPASAVPLEFRDVGLRAIALALIAPFGLELAACKETERFDKVALEPDGDIQGFLVDLAKQRGLVVNDTTEGKLRFWSSVATGSPVASFEEGERPLVRVEPSFSPQQFFSEITAYGKARHGSTGPKYSVRNTWLADVVRPHAFRARDTEPGGAPAAAKAKLGRMFGQMASFTLPDLPTWRDPQGDLWRENSTIRVKAPGAMIYDWTELLIRRVVLRRDEEDKVASLECCLPGAFSGELPDALPWAD